MDGIPLYLLRHGSPETPGLLMGRTDGAPTSGGIAACIEQARGLEVEKIISSDLRRAMQAARAIDADLKIPVTVDPRWRELDFGDWDGLAPSGIVGDALMQFWDDPDGSPPPNGERWSVLVARVAAALGEISVPTLIVTHGGAMRAALAHLCGFDHSQAWALDLPYGALLSLRLWSGDPPTAQIIGLRT